MATELEVFQAKEMAVTRYLAAGAPPAISAFAASTLTRVNLVGIGVGNKTQAGQPTGNFSVRFYVEHKLPRGVVGPASMLPEEINGVPTDVVETGKFRRLPTANSLPAAAIFNQGRFRPVQPGCSCGFRFPPSTGAVMAGTLGAIVSDANGHYILSNNHVLADEGNIPLGSPIFQPGLLDSGSAITDAVARLSKFIPISTTAMNHIDCAIARLNDPNVADPRFLPDVGALLNATVVQPSVGMHVIKTGRTTGATKGSITDIHATVNVQYDVGLCQFDEQIIIVGTEGPFSAAGDSGSIIVQANPKQATALLFAGSDTHTIANRLDTVLTALGVGLVV